jgi:hypothetical protein
MIRQMQVVPADAPRMPAFRGILTEDDAPAILAYLKTWWPPEQQRFQERTPMMPEDGCQIAGAILPRRTPSTATDC